MNERIGLPMNKNNDKIKTMPIKPKYCPNLYIATVFKKMIARFLKTDYAQKLIKKQKISYSH